MGFFFPLDSICNFEKDKTLLIVEVLVENINHPESRSKLFLGGDKDKHIGWVDVYNGVHVIEYIVERSEIDPRGDLIILPIGNCLKEECFGAFDRTRHKLPY